MVRIPPTAESGSRSAAHHIQRLLTIHHHFHQPQPRLGFLCHALRLRTYFAFKPLFFALCPTPASIFLLNFIRKMVRIPPTAESGSRFAAHHIHRLRWYIITAKLCISSGEACISSQQSCVYHHGGNTVHLSPAVFLPIIIYIKIPTVFVRIFTSHAKKTPLKLVEKSTSLKKAPNPHLFCFTSPHPPLDRGLIAFSHFIAKIIVNFLLTSQKTLSPAFCRKWLVNSVNF